MEDIKFAILIDSENISAKYIKYILSEVTKYGVITYKRIYGDWTNSQTVKWKNMLMEYSILPVQQFQNTVGKNSTDSALIIDAMDILYEDSVDGICIVSSDSDFTRLAGRLREAGKQVIGMGENKTPRSFRAACSVFTNLELLVEQEEDNEEAETAVEIVNEGTQYAQPASRAAIEDDIAAIIAENDDRNKPTGLAEIGNRLVKKYSDFDVRTYGYSTLSRFVGEIDRFEIVDEKGVLIVRLRNSGQCRAEIEEFARKTVTASGKNGMEMASLGHWIHTNYQGFRVKDYGYSTFARFVQCIPGLEVQNGKGTSRIVRLKADR
ncbi:MAG: NYN domain-containing protein [Clostridiaceae bacterium]|nr:NYN domain-containing protein [Clostridiaceae bacterium]